MNKLTLTTKQNKAKCLNYRNAKRCGRLGRYLVSGVRCAMGHGRDCHFKYPACEECKGLLVESGAEIKSFSPRGYIVTVSTFGPVSREYNPIAQVCAKCEQSAPVSPADAYCSPCGNEIMDAEHEYAALLASERTW